MPRMVITDEMRRRNPEGCAELERSYAEQDAATPVDQPPPAAEPSTQEPPTSAVTEPTQPPAEPSNPPAPPAAQAQPTPPAPAAPADDLRRQVDALNGRLGGVMRKVQELEQENADLRLRVSQAPAPAAPPPLPARSGAPNAPITDDEVLAVYGQELVDRKGFDELRDELRRERERDAKVELRLAQYDAERARERFFESVYAAEPKARQLDAEQATNGILDFLALPVPGRGSLTYANLYKIAMQGGDVDGLVSIYRDFLAAHPQAVKAVSTPARPAPPVAVQPGSPVPTSADAAVPTGKKVSQAGYAAWLDEVAKNPDKYTRAEREQREQEFAIARRNGNLIP